MTSPPLIYTITMLVPLDSLYTRVQYSTVLTIFSLPRLTNGNDSDIPGVLWLIITSPKLANGNRTGRIELPLPWPKNGVFPLDYILEGEVRCMCILGCRLLESN